MKWKVLSFDAQLQHKEDCFCLVLHNAIYNTGGNVMIDIGLPIVQDCQSRLQAKDDSSCATGRLDHG
jgi:hypothetical protein